MVEHALQQFLHQQLPAAPAARRLVIGLSGGLDSVALLQAAVAVAGEFALEVRALHVHHGLSPHADAWAQQVAELCKRLTVPLEIRRVWVEREQGSLEAAARAARYRTFADSLQADEALLLAQHQDDQAETLLFRLLRGAGLTGLGGMRSSRWLRNAANEAVPQWRPLLRLSRAQLQAYAAAHRLSWVEDESNQDRRHARNFLRHEILPRLQARWPVTSATLAATARRLQEADDLLQELAAELAVDCVDAGQRLLIPALLQLSAPRQRLLLRYWLRQQGYLLPGEAVLEKILEEMVVARADATPQLRWAGCELRRYRDRLYALAPLPAVPEDWECEWSGGSPLLLPDGRQLLASGELPSGPWQVRYRRGGERFRPAPHLSSRELKSLLQEAGIPPWERERLPLLLRDGVVVAVPGLALAGLQPCFRVEPAARNGSQT